MNTPLKIFLCGLLLSASVNTYSAASPKAGFSMPDSIREVTFQFKRAMDLILLPVTINDSIHVNLILDTGCRSLVLFGKRFNKLFSMQPGKTIQFSGLGTGKPVIGKISIENKVAIGAVLGERIPVVVVPNQNLFGNNLKVDGIIGYDVFIKFEIELNMPQQSITFRPASSAELPADYLKIPLRLEDSLPIVNSTVFFSGSEGQPLDLLIDTGSSLGLLIKAANHEMYPSDLRLRVLGRGLNGLIEGTQASPERLLLDTFELKNVVAGIIQSPWHTYSSVGMAIMKEYSIVLNYCKSYVGFRREVPVIFTAVVGPQKGVAGREF